MSELFDRDFWKFTIRFICIISVALAGLYVFSHLGTESPSGDEVDLAKKNANITDVSVTSK